MTKLEEEHLDIIEKTDWILDLHLKNLKMAIEMLQGNEEENKYLYMCRLLLERVNAVCYKTKRKM